MFGPFTAGDSLRVYRLQRKGISLDLQRYLIQPATPLREAWLAFLTQQAMGRPTYVLYDLHDGEGFVQLRYRPHQTAVDVAFLAPALGESPMAASAWFRLLDGACVEAAGRGIQRVFANLPESGAEAEVFHQAGFVLYAGEDLYRLGRPPTAQLGTKPPPVRAQRPEDWPSVQKLCVAVTPQRVRQTEGGISVAAGGEKDCQRYVLPGEHGEDLMAALTLCRGGQAHWLRVLVHPDARELTDGLIRWAVTALAGESIHPIYCNVRQYESGVRLALETAGFEFHATRSLMVKHTLAWGKAPAPELAKALAGGAEIAPPAYHINGEAELPTPKGRLAATRES